MQKQRSISARGLAIAVITGMLAGLALASCRFPPFGRPQPQIVEYTVVGDDFKFNPNRLSIPQGREVRILFRNQGRLEHDFHIENLEARISDKNQPGGEEHPADRPGSVHVHAGSGRSATITFLAEERGTFRFICTVPGHEQLGMFGEVTVR